MIIHHQSRFNVNDLGVLCAKKKEFERVMHTTRTVANGCLVVISVAAPHLERRQVCPEVHLLQARRGIHKLLHWNKQRW